MRRMIMAGLMAVHAVGTPVHAQQASEPEPPMPAALEPAPAGEPTGLTDAVIQKAVRETVAEDADSKTGTNTGINRDAGALSAGKTESIMSAAFDQAKVPDCLHADALKNQPARIGFIGVGGPYALPWVIAAALRGKCL
ncbi:hypothetical protein NHH82_13890 [Oxalobacteraceae bacterium OTU3REALA1]|nr:hypothetical protein NHH82_13890 [Oxalobacteraceae bacterium OTU3REALA1]